MKKCMAIFIAVVFVFSLSACSPKDTSNQDLHNSGENRSDTAEPSQNNDETDENTFAQNTDSEASVLIAYFSWADNAMGEGEVDAVTSPSVTAPGNVAQLASWVQEKTGGDLFSIQVTEPYPDDWDACLERANEERAENKRPELKQNVENMEDYDVIFLGYPNWWYGAPMAVLSFLEENDLSEKQVYLFCSHGTGGLAGSVDDIEKALPETTGLSEDVFDVYEEDVPSSQNDILDWLNKIGY